MGHVVKLPFLSYGLKVNAVKSPADRERSGSVVELLTRDRRAAGLSTGA